MNPDKIKILSIKIYILCLLLQIQSRDLKIRAQD